MESETVVPALERCLTLQKIDQEEEWMCAIYRSGRGGAAFGRVQVVSLPTNPAIVAATCPWVTDSVRKLRMVTCARRVNSSAQFNTTCIAVTGLSVSGPGFTRRNRLPSADTSQLRSGAVVSYSPPSPETSAWAGPFETAQAS